MEKDDDFRAVVLKGVAENIERLTDTDIVEFEVEVARGARQFHATSHLSTTSRRRVRTVNFKETEGRAETGTRRKEER